MTNTDKRSETLNGYFLDELLVIAQKYWIGKGGLKKIGWECSSVQSSIDPPKFNSIPSRSIRAPQWLSMCASAPSPQSHIPNFNMENLYFPISFSNVNNKFANSQEFCSTPRCNLETSFFSEVTPFTSEEGPHLVWEKSNILISSWNQENLWETEGCSGWRDRPGLLVKWLREIRSLFCHANISPISPPARLQHVSHFICSFGGSNVTSYLQITMRAFDWKAEHVLLLSLSLCVFSPSQLAAYLFGLLEQVNLELLLVHHYCCCSTWTQRCPLLVPRLTHVYTTHCSHCDNIHFLHLTYCRTRFFFFYN